MRLQCASRGLTLPLRDWHDLNSINDWTRPSVQIAKWPLLSETVGIAVLKPLAGTKGSKEPFPRKPSAHLPEPGFCLSRRAGAPAEGGGGEGARPNERGNQVGTGVEDGEAAALSRENLGSHLGEILS